MTEGPLNHPGDETLRALSLGQLDEAELAQVSAHLGNCPACCRRIDQLAADDRLLARLQQGAASRENVLVGPAQRRSAVRALRLGYEARLAARKGDSKEVPVVPPVPQQGGDHDTRAEVGREGMGVGYKELLGFLDRCDTPGRLGQLLHYEILDVVGHGGMGTVLRGLDVKLNRVVAIKVLAPQLAANAVARQRFHREAQAAAAVRHHHVVAIHAVDEFHGLPYLVMEYVSGSSLQQKLDDSGPLQLAQILRIGMQIASGLAAVHAQGLVHRDIKPANILLENGIERVKITDFGLARSIDDVRITQAGMVYGTPQYMSPEQAQGERVDQRSDLFSLGSVLYAMSTCRSPFRGETTMAVLKRVCDDTPRPIREVNPDIPAALAEIVNKLLAKDPDARPQTAAEVAELLSRFLAQLQHDPLTPFQGEEQTQPVPIRKECPDRSSKNNRRPKHRPARSRLRSSLFVGTVALFTGIAVLAALEGTHFTSWTGLAAPRMTSANEEAPAAPETTSAGEEAPAGPEPRPAAPSNKKPGAGATDRPVKVFVLAGDYNMAGRAKVALLKYQANQAETRERFQHLLHDGKWIVREDVWIKTFQRKGNLTVGFGHTPEHFGPELEFGNVVGDHFDEQVLLIKTCCGDSLNCDFRPPSAGPPSQKLVEQNLRDMHRPNPKASLADVERGRGAAYREMVKEVRDTLANLAEHFPTYQGQGFEIAGVVWFQGWNDLEYTAFHAELLAHLIRDVRRDFRLPNLPFVIGQLGVHGGGGLQTNDLHLRAAQAAVAQLPEFTSNVRLVATDPYWDHEAVAALKKNKDEWEKFVSDVPYRYFGSARTYCSIGKAFGEAMIELRRSAARK